MEILSSFTHTQVFPNLYEFLSSIEHKKRYSEECNQTVDGSHWLLMVCVWVGGNMEINRDQKLFNYSSKYYFKFNIMFIIIIWFYSKPDIILTVNLIIKNHSCLENIVFLMTTT